MTMFKNSYLLRKSLESKYVEVMREILKMRENTEYWWKIRHIGLLNKSMNLR